jgi:predicted RNA-binding protein with PUA-like domain
MLVDLAFVRKLKRVITLNEIKELPGLEDMILTRRGNRLSIMPVEPAHWKLLLSLE